MILGAAFVILYVHNHFIIHNNNFQREKEPKLVVWLNPQSVGYKPQSVS